MALSSMTGFARSHGASGPYSFEWELKSVNAKGLDVRVRLPQGWDEVEAFAKKRATEVLSRGTVYANLTVKRTETGATVRINEDVLAAVVKVASSLSGRIDAVAPSIDGLLSKAGCVAIGGTPLFRLVASTGATDIAERLARRGIHVRRFPAQPNWLRFGLPGDEAAWQRLTQALGDAG